MPTSTRLSYLLRLLTVGVLLVASSSGAASVVVKTEELQEYAEYMAVFQASFSNRSSQAKNIVVTLGKEALIGQLSSGDKTPVIALMVTSATFKEISEAFEVSRRTALTAIYSEPDPLLQIALAKAISKNSRILIPKTFASGASISGDEPAIRRRGVDVLTVAPGDVRAVLDSMDKYDVLLAIPDKTLYNLSSMQPIVTSLYRRQKFMIGFSKGMTDAGALAAIATDVGQLELQLKKILHNYDQTGALPPPGFSSEYSVHANKVLARSLGIYNIDEAVLQRKLISTEGQASE